MRRICLLTALLLLLAAVPAEAASRIVVRGGGFGHGIGLNQQGSDRRQVMHRYCRGVDIDRASSRAVRVLLQASDPYVRFRGATRLTTAGGSERLRPSSTYVVRPSAGGISVKGVGRVSQA